MKTHAIKNDGDDCQDCGMISVLKNEPCPAKEESKTMHCLCIKNDSIRLVSSDCKIHFKGVKTMHTPGPWKINKDKRFSSIRIESPVGDEICLFRYPSADAEFIVTACNAHEDLVKALHKISRMPCIQELLGEKDDEDGCGCASCISKEALTKAGVSL